MADDKRLFLTIANDLASVNDVLSKMAEIGGRKLISSNCIRIIMTRLVISMDLRVALMKMTLQKRSVAHAST